MSNDELQAAISHTHGMLEGHSMESDIYKTIKAHLVRLLHIQQARAAGSAEEGTPC